MTRPIILRSELSVPAGNPRMIEKALASEADAFFLDLEDSVAPASKDDAREAARAALSAGYWADRERVARINGIGTRWCLGDVLALAPLVQRIVVPKVRNAGDVAYLDRLIDAASADTGRERGSVWLEVQIEDPHGLANLDAILAESDRIAVATFGQGDFAAAAGMPAEEIGVADEWDRQVAGDRWLFPRQQIVFAAARAGIPALNGPYAAFRDGEGFASYCRMSRALGFAGVWCIHPSQIAIANEIFSPSKADVARAEAVLADVAAGWSQGSGAIARSALMTDEANVRMAKSLLDRAEAIRRQTKTGTQ